MVATKLRPYEVWEPPTGHQKVRPCVRLDACLFGRLAPPMTPSPPAPDPDHDDPHPPRQMTRRLHELLPVRLQHALRDRYLGAFADSTVKASALLVGLRYPRAVLKCVSFCEEVFCVCVGVPFLRQPCAGADIHAS